MTARTPAHEIMQALQLGFAWHGDQVRKGTRVPYVSHLLQVSGLVLEHGGDADQAAAGILHDALEDAPQGERAGREKTIQEVCGDGVLAIVLDCTDTQPDESADTKRPWRMRKGAYLSHLAAASPRSLLVAACDKRQNLGAMVWDTAALGVGYLDRFNADPADQVWYFSGFLEAIRGRIPPRLEMELESLLHEFGTLAHVPTELPLLLARMRAWAARTGVVLDEAGRTSTIEGNLFRPLHRDTRAEFSVGAGNELGGAGVPGSIQSARSSAALVCNAFDAWRDKDLQPLARALGADPRVSQLAFEAKFPTGLRGAPPHLDVLLSGEGVIPTAVESKFSEIYDHEAENAFADSYLEASGIWTDLPRARLLGEAMAEQRVRFKRLGAAQLLKHILGLTQAHGKAFRLVYLWYDAGGPIASEHRYELGTFQRWLGDEVAFVPLTYQDLFARFSGDLPPDQAQYLRGRYLPGVSGAARSLD